MKRSIKAVVHKYKLGEEPSDFSYWRRQSVIRRLSTAEELRQLFYQMKYGTRPKFQRVCRIIKPVQS
jgi:ribosomal protein S19E (S16A)